MKKFLMVLAVILMAGMVLGCSRERQPERSRDRLVIAWQQDFNILSPFDSSATPDITVAYALYDSLFDMDLQGNLFPTGAERWEISPDGLEYTFYIRRGMTFHDGSPVTARDVVYSGNRLRDSPFRQRVGVLMDRAELIDDYTMKFILHQRAAQFMFELAFYFAIYPENAGERWGDNFGRHPIASGPYQLVSREAGRGVILQAYDGYWGPAPPIKEVEFRVIPDATTALIALENGEVDLCQYIAAASYPLVRRNPNLGMVSTPFPRVLNLAMNMQMHPFQDNVHLRQAIAHAINKDFLVEIGLEGHGRPAVTFLQDINFGYPPGIVNYARNFDLARARELMVEAGYPNGAGLPAIRMSTIDMFRMQSEAIQAQLREIGVNIEIEMVELSAWMSMMASGTLWMGLMSWNTGLDGAGPSGLLSTGSASNQAVYSNPEVDRLFTISAAELDARRRSDIFLELYRAVLDDMPYVSIYFVDTVSCGRNDLDMNTWMNYVATSAKNLRFLN